MFQLKGGTVTATQLKAKENTKVLIAGGDGGGNVIVSVAHMPQSHKGNYIWQLYIYGIMD